MVIEVVFGLTGTGMSLNERFSIWATQQEQQNMLQMTQIEELKAKQARARKFIQGPRPSKIALWYARKYLPAHEWSSGRVSWGIPRGVGVRKRLMRSGRGRGRGGQAQRRYRMHLVGTGAVRKQVARRSRPFVRRYGPPTRHLDDENDQVDNNVQSNMHKGATWRMHVNWRGRGRGRGWGRGRGRGRGGGFGRGNPQQRSQRLPTKEELDLEIDQYMAMTKSALDRQLDEYMASAPYIAGADGSTTISVITET